MAKQIGTSSVTLGEEIPRISGIFEGTEERADKQNEGKTLTVILLTLDDGGKVSVRMNPVLREMMEGVKPGSRIGIRYDGLYPSKNGKQPTKLFSVWGLEKGEEW